MTDPDNTVLKNLKDFLEHAAQAKIHAELAIGAAKLLSKTPETRHAVDHCESMTTEVVYKEFQELFHKLNIPIEYTLKLAQSEFEVPTKEE